ncbi:DUF3052 domain-containing protein, partial [Leptospira borgpetersenii serovar Hardjo-bovis]|nr:DUF3052 domain-containing protein [Leptospira borgpetersenii serovar Hardjo-bovis]
DAGESLGDKLWLKAVMKGFCEGLPEGVRKELKDHLTDGESFKILKDSLNYLHVFVKESGELRKRFPKLVEHLSEKGMILISWPKASSKVSTDINENIVRIIGLELGIVDVKVCAVSDILSGLKFYRR